MTIDLGQISATSAAPQPAASRTRGRAQRFVLLLLLLFPLVTGEERVGEGVPQVVLPAADDQGLIILGGTAGPGGVPGHLVLSAELAGPTGSQLTARRLPGLEPMWQVPAPFDAEQNLPYAVAAADVLLVTWWARYEESDPGETVALDRSDGTTRWRHAGRVVEGGGAGPVLLYDEPMGAVHSIDPGSGRVRWSSPVPAEAWPFVHDPGDATPAVWILIDQAGRLEVRDLDANRLLGSREVVVGDQNFQIWVAGDILLLGDEQRATAYGFPDLRPRWELTWRGAQETPLLQFSGCGAMPCLVGDDEGWHLLAREWALVVFGVL